jgi:hypothetical protein
MRPTIGWLRKLDPMRQVSPEGGYSIPFTTLPTRGIITGPRYIVPLHRRRFHLNITTRMAVAELLTILKTNRDRHAELYAEAVQGYCQKAVAYLKDKIQTLSANTPCTVHMGEIRPPDDHTGDYDRVIAMLSRTKEQDIVLGEEQYSQLVDDEWDWAERWAACNSDYSVKTASYALSKGWRR